MVRSRHPASTYLVLAIAVTSPVSADIRTAGFGVSAQVVARTWIEPVDEPATFVLTQTDLEQGYKVLDVHYRVHTARTSRYLLNIAPRIGLADCVHVEGLDGPVKLGQVDVTVLQQAPANISELRLRLRLTLRPGLTTGGYPMPVRLSVSDS